MRDSSAFTVNSRPAALFAQIQQKVVARWPEARVSSIFRAKRLSAPHTNGEGGQAAVPTARDAWHSETSKLFDALPGPMALLVSIAHAYMPHRLASGRRRARIGCDGLKPTTRCAHRSRAADDAQQRHAGQ